MPGRQQALQPGLCGAARVPVAMAVIAVIAVIASLAFAFAMPGWLGR